MITIYYIGVRGNKEKKQYFFIRIKASARARIMVRKWKGVVQTRRSTFLAPDVHDFTRAH